MYKTLLKKQLFTSLLIIYLFSTITVIAQVENSIFAIVKFSYNQPGDTTIEGGICGSAFLLNDSTVITSNHVINSNVFKPNSGYNHVRFWLLNRDNVTKITLTLENLESIPEVETTIIKLPNNLKCIWNVLDTSLSLAQPVQGFGHIIDNPVIDSHWQDDSLVIDSFSLTGYKADSDGIITEMKTATIDLGDIKITNLEVIRPSFKAQKGMSGGPLISGNKIIGMLSYGFPVKSDYKHIVYAISINEILKEIHRLNPSIIKNY